MMIWGVYFGFFRWVGISIFLICGLYSNDFNSKLVNIILVYIIFCYINVMLKKYVNCLI